jgi:5-(aminomethyl)-3-furanmethanol phosphate kinase
VSNGVTVVKLGGSYAQSSLLRLWLQAIERHAGRVVLVPGGGPFADCVRTAQAWMGFDEAAAHEMALLGMAQYGRALVSLGSCMRMADDIAAIRAALRDQQVPVWSPLRLILPASDVAASWNVTSDSLAVWLAGRLAADSVVIVKHRAGRGTSVASLVAEGLLDLAFPDFLADFAGPVFLAAPEDLAAASVELAIGRRLRAPLAAHG